MQHGHLHLMIRPNQKGTTHMSKRTKLAQAEQLQRIAELEFELEEATETGNVDRVAEIEFELEQIV
jgi:hypothetical protein